MPRTRAALLASLLLAATAAGAQQPKSPPPDTTRHVPADTSGTARAAAVEVGTGRATLGGLLQAWFTAGGGASTFRVRRAEIKLSGQITPQARWNLMVDLAKALTVNTTSTTVGGTRVVTGESVNQASRILQDASITVDLGHGVRLDAGQFKVPQSMEGLASAAALETVERALFVSDRARGGTGDVRDIGVGIRGTLARAVDYQAGLFNGLGESVNATDVDRAKSAGVRATVRLPLPGLVQVGGSGALDLAARGDSAGRRRAGVELAATEGPVTLRSEVVALRDGTARRRGWYAHAGYRFTPRVQAVARVDAWDPDTRRESGAADARERDYLGGVNYYVVGNNLKVQANLVRKTFGAAVPSRNVLLLNLQTAW